MDILPVVTLRCISVCLCLQVSVLIFLENEIHLWGVSTHTLQHLMKNKKYLDGKKYVKIL